MDGATNNPCIGLVSDIKSLFAKILLDCLLIVNNEIYKSDHKYRHDVMPNKLYPDILAIQIRSMNHALYNGC